MTDRLVHWWAAREDALSETGVHEENLAYLLSELYRPEDELSQLVVCFSQLVTWARHAGDVERVLGICFLDDVVSAEAAFPGYDDLPIPATTHRPPSVVLRRGSDPAAWRSRFEGRERPLEPPSGVPPGTGATWSVSRQRSSADPTYQASIVLELGLAFPGR